MEESANIQNPLEPDHGPRQDRPRPPAGAAKDGRASIANLAEAVSLTETPCARRLKRLEAEGYIDGYRTILSRSALKLGVLAFACVRFGVHTRELSDRFEREIRRFLASCHATTYPVVPTIYCRSSPRTWTTTGCS
jgi:DNA-binding Lrp family transcriptional regulator